MSEQKQTPQKVTTGRPFILDPLFWSVTNIAGVGPSNAKRLESLCGPKLLDVLFHLPAGLIDRRYNPQISQLQAGQVATLCVTITEHTPPARRNLPYRVFATDGTGMIEIPFFNAKGDWLSKKFPIGSKKIISGRIDFFHGQPQMPHPDHVGNENEKEKIMRIEPVYPLTAGLSNIILNRCVAYAVDKCPDLPEWQNKPFLKQQGWESWSNSLKKCHNPQNLHDLEPSNPVRMRLAYDELLASQLTLAIIRHRQRKNKGRILRGHGKLYEKAFKAVPFSLTEGQKSALQDIREDMHSPSSMLRLIQGDVGSGKTVVAFLAAAIAIDAGTQVAFMAPTEILATQHADTLLKLCEKADIRTAFLSGSIKGKKRNEILEKCANGEIDLLIGTHALFQTDVAFKDLGLAIIDEQHRFGVKQRLALSDKGKGVDILTMTATPIPRSLTMTAYGDMDVSRIKDKPKGRLPIDTKVMGTDKMEDLAHAVHRKISQGEQVFWVCPLVEESEKIDLAAAEERYADLQHRFGGVVGLVHGKMKADEKDAVMERFKAGELKILVATTVIEVGVDVPNATIMVIEHAERFGLSQLHQLRGRVGRGSKAGYCLLLYSPPLGEIARQRLETMRNTNDGFEIAEMDLKLRGSGDVLGTRQSGLPDFKFVDLSAHEELLLAARDDANLIMRKDPELSSDRGQALRHLLYLFERDKAITYLRGG